MGDQIGSSVRGSLEYVSIDEISKLLDSSLEIHTKKSILADICRLNALFMIAKAGSGHIGSSFSSMDIMTSIMYDCLFDNRLDKKTIFFSSKGHDTPALYSNLMAFKQLDFDFIHGLRTLSGLPGHPDVATKGIFTNTGSLGMGVSKAKGFITANRIFGNSTKVFVLTGDGELQEGQFWESLLSAVNNKMDELTIIVDHNKLQSDTLVSQVSDLGNLQSKFESFGFFVHRCNGNSIEEIDNAIHNVKSPTGQPRAIIADTIKGKGVSFMEHTSIDSDVELYKYHSGAPDSDSYFLALDELKEKINKKLESNSMSDLKTVTETRSELPNIQDNKVKLVSAYTEALLNEAKNNTKIMALDADLVLDTGLIPFQKNFPDRFIECGIAEQDMVSQAGTIALSGLLPIVHSFACFLTARPMEQIYNNASEKSKIIYIGTLAGLIPAGPGHSHQGVRDIATMGSVSGMTVIEPSNPLQVKDALEWAVKENDSSTYIRLCSVPVDVNDFNQPLPQMGYGQYCREGDDGIIFTYGPIMLKNAISASDELKNNGKNIAVINLPWLNKINLSWLESVMHNQTNVLVCDNHYVIGGLSDRIAESLLRINTAQINFKTLGVKGIPVCGSPDEVLNHHEIDTESIKKIFL